MVGYLALIVVLLYLSESLETFDRSSEASLHYLGSKPRPSNSTLPASNFSTEGSALAGVLGT